MECPSGRPHPNTLLISGRISASETSHSQLAMFHIIHAEQPLRVLTVFWCPSVILHTHTHFIHTGRSVVLQTVDPTIISGTVICPLNTAGYCRSEGGD